MFTLLGLPLKKYFMKVSIKSIFSLLTMLIEQTYTHIADRLA